MGDPERGWSWARTASLLFVLVASGYFIVHLIRHFSEIPRIEWTAAAALAVVVSVSGVLITIVLIGAMWRLLLSDQGVRLPLRRAVQIIAVSQIGKYLPGNVGHYVGRAALASTAGVPVGVTVSTTLIEVIWTVAIGAGLASLAVALFVDAFAQGGGDSIGTPHLVLAGGVLAVLPWLGVRLLNRFFPRLSRRLNGGEPVVAPRLGTAAIVAAMLIVCFLILGLSLTLQAWALFGVETPNFVAFTLLFAAAWVVGYVVPGAPGGLGVREGMMVLLFTPVVGAGAAVGLGITTRLLTVVGDGLGFLLGIVGRGRVAAYVAPPRAG